MPRDINDLLENAWNQYNGTRSIIDLNVAQYFKWGFIAGFTQIHHNSWGDFYNGLDHRISHFYLSGYHDGEVFRRSNLELAKEVDECLTSYPRAIEIKLLD